MPTGKKRQLFREVTAQRLIHPGAPEGRIHEGITALAQEVYGITQCWHKRIERASPNTLLPYDDNPPALIVKEAGALDLGRFLRFGKPILAEHCTGR